MKLGYNDAIMCRVSRRQLLSGAAVAPFLHIAGRAATRKPNVVMFMTDDHGAWATGAYGCRDMHTPHINRLAAGGTRFTRAFACTPVCSPSRMTYMTGRIPSQHHVQDWLRPIDSFGPRSHRWLAGQPTYSEALAAHGYQLGMSGKWHMGEDAQAQAGFTWWNTVPGGGGTYKNPTFVKNGKLFKTLGYKTDFVTAGAIDFLDQVGDGPFFLYAPFYAPHTPYNFQPSGYQKPYRNCAFSCFPDLPMNPWQNPSLKGLFHNRHAKLAYSSLITGVDYSIGLILKRLEDLGLRDNTLVIFTADQGWNAGHHGVWGKGNGTIPFNMYEQSLQVPLLWNFPGRIAAGKTLNPMVSSYDFMPTILDYLGVPIPDDPERVGRSYAPFLRGEHPEWRNRLYFEYCYVRGIRTENLKLIVRTKKWPSELYDLEADPNEKRNLIDDPSYASERKSLRADLDNFFRRAGAPPLDKWRTTTTQHLTVYHR